MKKKYSSSDISYRNVECSFDNPIEFFSKESRLFFAQCPRSVKRTKLHEKIEFSLRMFLWTRRLQLWQPYLKILSQNTGNVQLNVRKWWTILFLFRRKIFLQIVPLDTCTAVLSPPPKNFRVSSRTGSLNFRKHLQIANVLKKTYFPFRYVKWTRKTQFWQPRQYFFDKKPKTSLSMPEKQ